MSLKESCCLYTKGLPVGTQACSTAVVKPEPGMPSTQGTHSTPSWSFQVDLEHGGRGQFTQLTGALSLCWYEYGQIMEWNANLLFKIKKMDHKTIFHLWQ